jgi:serine/threonine-protein kinase
MIQDYERQRRIESYFQEALDAAPGQRASVVARLCGGDRELEAAVEELLRHHDEGGTSAPMDPGRVLGPVAEPTAPVPGAAREATTADFVGRTIGPFRLIRELGSGGMGRVFLAERVDLPRRVALKLVREPLASPERTSRFELEQRVLARLEHPAIAQLFDAGVTEDGAPWFAMEFVEGAPITAYCDRGRLTVDARIRLVLSVLDAVQYSHARLIVHRDLKPSNILVAAGGMPKLVDFGIAKLLDDQEDPGLTRTGLLMLTPSYAAPEQFAGGPVTTATDVYQIGAVLYELLTGATPFETGGRSLSEIERDIRTIEPKPPSSRVTEARTASERGTSPDRLRRRLRGDLDHIVAKALEKDPARRYASAADMAEDLRLFLAHEPVAARAQTPLERSRRFLRRHRVAAGVAAALLIYAATASIGLVRISAERDRAQREADTATRVSDFLVGVFAAADPSDTTTGDPTALGLVDRGAARAEADLADEPAMLASMQEVLGRVYHELGRDDQAGDLLSKSLETRRRLFGDDAIQVASAKHHLAQVLWATGDLAGADTLVRGSLAVNRRLLGERSERVFENLNDLATIQHVQGDLDGAETTLRELITLVREAHPEGYPWSGLWLNNLANIYNDQGRFAEAESTMRLALVSDRQVLAEPHPNIALRLDNLAAMSGRNGRHAESLDLARQALAQYAQIYPGPHPDVPYALTNLGRAALALGNVALADSAQRAALGMREALYPGRHPDMVPGYRAYGEYLLDRGRPAEATRYFERWRDLAAELYGQEHFLFGTAIWRLALSAEALGRLDEAERLFRRGLSIHVASLGSDHTGVQSERRYLEEFLRGRGKVAEAEALASPAPPG